MYDPDDPVMTTVGSYELAFEEFTENTRRVDTFPGLQDELDRFVDILNGDRVLDVGFGSGRDILYFQSQGLEVYGVEMTANFIYSLRRISSMPLCCMDARRLGFADDVFDGVWCCATLLHLPRAQAKLAIREFNRVLHPGGALYISIKEGEGDEWIEEGHIGLPRYFTYFSLDEMKSLIENEQFSVQHVQTKAHQAGRRTWVSLYARKLTK